MSTGYRVSFRCSQILSLIGVHSLEAEFYSAEKGAVVIRDEGFGTMFPTTNKIYRKEFDLKWEK